MYVPCTALRSAIQPKTVWPIGWQVASQTVNTQKQKQGNSLQAPLLPTGQRYRCRNSNCAAATPTAVQSVQEIRQHQPRWEERRFQDERVAHQVPVHDKRRLVCRLRGHWLERQMHPVLRPSHIHWRSAPANPTGCRHRPGKKRQCGRRCVLHLIRNGRRLGCWQPTTVGVAHRMHRQCFPFARRHGFCQPRPLLACGRASFSSFLFPTPAVHLRLRALLHRLRCYWQVCNRAGRKLSNTCT